MDYYQRQQQKAEEMIDAWLYAFKVCIVLAGIWAVIEYLRG